MADTPDWRARVHPELRSLARKMPFWTWRRWTVRLMHGVERLVPQRTPAFLEHHVLHGATFEVHVYRPRQGTTRPGAVLYLHGGGLLIGHPRLFVAQIARIATGAGVVVAAVRYRRAFEAPFPAALDDCHGAFHTLVDQAEALGIDPTHIVVAGGSAGGGLAAALVQRLHDEAGPRASAQALIYPMLDDRTAFDPERTAQEHLVWNNTSNRLGWTAYLGASAGAQAPPYAAAARRDDLSGLPPTWITVGDLDLFHDEDLVYAARLRDAGVPVELLEVQGGFHGFLQGPESLAPIQRVWASLDGFLAQHLG